MPKFERIVILSDGIRGHYHQSLGIAQWLERLGAGRLEETITVPKFSGLERFMRLKVSARGLATHGADYARRWLENSGLALHDSDSRTLFISTGSSAAPFCLACAKATGNKSAVIMTPSVLGTKPFNYAIVPEHDKHDSNDAHILSTLGAPNHIDTDQLRQTAEKFFAGYDFGDNKVVALLIGGSDANYKPNPAWAYRALAPLRDVEGVKILLTTSRRTGQALDDAIADIFGGTESMGYMLLLSRNDDPDALRAMLGRATHVLVTEDSVSMVSEAATAGFRVGLLRVPRSTGLVKRLCGFGAERFDAMFESMRQRDLLVDLGETPDFTKFLVPESQRHNRGFNEAKRAAEWIISQH